MDAFHGIEIQVFPSRIAEVALWLVDHQMNMRLSEVFGQYYVRIPLKTTPHIINGNALDISWDAVIPPKNLSYILGNPPFVGKQHRDASQQADMARVFNGITGAGILDYVTAWYVKAASYIQGTRIKCAFVSTNSITQGEQVGILWKLLLEKYGIKLHFAHRTFAWGSEVPGKANVHVVIIGFGNFDIRGKKLFDYQTAKSDPHELPVRNISPYLVEGDDTFVEARTKPLCNVPEIVFGSMPNDGGYLLFTDEEKREFLKKEPGASSYFRPLLGSAEFIDGETRWCLWLVDAKPAELRKLPRVMDRIKGVQEHRKKSKRKTTQELAATPSLFGEIRQRNYTFVIVPRHSSENRKYIPMGFFGPENIVHDSCLFIPEAELFHFGVLCSEMHMTWVRYIGGRLESRYRYSNRLVYNNYPWPQNPSPAQARKIEECAQAVLVARAKFLGGSSLADIYDPRTMPIVLLKAHQALDRAVDQAYRRHPFTGERGRIEFLFDLHQMLTVPLLVAKKKGRRKKKRHSR